MISLAASLVVLCFVTVLRLVGIQRIAVSVVKTGSHAVSFMRDASVPEHDKEQEVRRASGALMGGFLSILWRAGLAASISLLPAWMLHAAGLAPWSAVTDLLLTWRGLVIALIATVAVYSAPNRAR